ncbi:MAG: hypothetical protein BYD32DRAFT_402454 [Podila humilis]|nr:MAG: hypothetical protein BYD32DRAFT_402454 [Podila humilis]
MINVKLLMASGRTFVSVSKILTSLSCKVPELYPHSWMSMVILSALVKTFAVLLTVNADRTLFSCFSKPTGPW